jgi:adenosylhomocysteine nucleosidase
MIWVLVALENELSNDYFYDNRPDTSFQISYTGVGKVNAAITAMRYGKLAGCTKVINYGTAGIVSKKDLIGKLVKPDVILQRDMLAEPQAPRGVTPFEKDDTAGPIMLDTNTNITLGTGDSFVMEYDEWFDYANVDLVDMEAYAIAKATNNLNIPFECYKYVSDFADENAAETWEENANKGAAAFMEMINDIYSK